MKCQKKNIGKWNVEILLILFHCFIITFWINLNAEVRSKTAISVYGLKSIGIPQSLAESLQEHLESNLLKFEQYNVLSRNDIDIILKESRFQQTGICSDENCLAEAGHILGIEKIITGTISMVGSTYNIVLKMIDVKTAKLESSVNQKHSGNIDTLLDVIEVSLHILLEEEQKAVREKEKRENVEKLKTELAELKNKAAQLHEVREELQEKKQELEETQHNYELSKTAELQLKQKLRETEETQQDIDSTNVRYGDTEEPAFKANNSDIQNQDKVSTSKKGKKIGIGAIALLTTIGVGVLVYQLLGGSN